MRDLYRCFNVQRNLVMDMDLCWPIIGCYFMGKSIPAAQ